MLIHTWRFCVALPPLQVTLFALGAWQAVSIITFAVLNHVSGQRWRSTYLRLPVVGVAPVNGVLAATLGGCLCITWAAWHNAVWSWPLQVRRALSSVPWNSVLSSKGVVPLPGKALSLLPGPVNPACCLSGSPCQRVLILNVLHQRHINQHMQLSGKLLS
jgi:hypothetical protein